MTEDTDDESRSISEQHTVVERRDDGRVRVVTEVTMKSITNFTALGTDLSVGGIFVVTPHHIERGAEIDIEFSVEGIDESFESVGKVQWSHRQPVGEQSWWGYGIEFQDLDPQAHELLEEFVRRREPLEKYDSIPPNEE